MDLILKSRLIVYYAHPIWLYDTDEEEILIQNQQEFYNSLKLVLSLK